MLASMNTELTKTGASVERYRTLLEVNNAVITNLRREDLLPAICAALRRVMFFDAAALSIFDPKRNALRFFALEGDFRSTYFVKGLVLKLEDSVSGEAFHNQRAIFRCNLATEQQYISERRLAAEGVRSTCIAPLILRGKSIGTLNITSFTTDQYAQEDADFLQEVANQVALAIANMNAYEEIAALSLREAATAARHRSLLDITNAIINSLTQDDLLNAVCVALKKVLPFDVGGLQLYEPQSDALRVFSLVGDETANPFAPGQLIPFKDDGSGQIIDFRRQQLERDLALGRKRLLDEQIYEAGIRAYCSVPLLVQEEFVGTLGIGSVNANQYAESDMEFLQEVANQIALAVANMRAYGEIQALGDQQAAAAERRQTLLEINNAIISKLTKEDLSHAVFQSLLRVMPFDFAGFHLYEAETNGLRFIAQEGAIRPAEINVGQLLPLDNSIAGEAFRLRRPALRRNLAVERQYPSEEIGYAAGLRSVCAVPLIVHGESIGTLSVTSLTPDKYNDNDAEFLQEVANQVALAIDNMQTYEQVKDLSEREAAAAERRRTLLEINNAIVSKLTQEDLCKAVFEALPKIVPFDRIGISLFDYEQDAYRLIALSEGESAYFNVGTIIPRQAAWVTDEFTLLSQILVCDLENHDCNPFEQQLLADGVRSFCVAPLLVKNRVIGALSVTSKTRNQYCQADVERLQEVANQVALAIANMQAFEEIAALKARLQAENIYLQEEIRQEHNFDEIVGNSPVLLDALQKVEQVARTDSTVLILGESGTGKELFARAIHEHSTRKNHPLVKVNCGAISAGLVESELFGHTKGAFTGAVDKRIGRFELANGGTLFLDEVGELPLETQVKLLRVLQEGEFEPVGSNKTITVNVRIIAATNRNLEEEVRRGRFRADLYYRLNVFPIAVPALRERLADIPQLALFFVTRFARKFGKPIEGIAQETMQLLTSYPWHGNIRELQNIIERAVITSQSPALTLDKRFLSPVEIAQNTPPEKIAPLTVNGSGAAFASPAVAKAEESSLSLEEAERRHILDALQRTHWVIEGQRGAAILLDLHPNTLRSRMKKLGIKRPSA